MLCSASCLRIYILGILEGDNLFSGGIKREEGFITVIDLARCVPKTSTVHYPLKRLKILFRIQKKK